MSLLLKDALSMAEARFEAEKILTPALDAELLFAFISSKDRAWQFLNYGKTVDEDLCERFFRLVDERCTGVPLQYITGSQEFMGLNFIVNENVLIPRQDTELLVETALDIIKETRKPSNFKILEIGCGSGAISVSLAHSLKNRERKAGIVATDISDKALAVAKTNAIGNQLEKQIEFISSDLFASFPLNRKGKGKRLFNMIISNPPYIPTGEMDKLMREVRDHEPSMALDGGPDGLDFYREIVGRAPAHLADKGTLLLEIGHDQGQALLEMGEMAEVFEPGEIVKDYSGLDRVVVFKLKGGRK